MSDIFQFALIAVPVVLLYFLPTFVAAYRSCKAGGGIAVINVFLGWTFIGWVVALAWAACGEVKPATVS
jgi:Superinfection immunity protein